MRKKNSLNKEIKDKTRFLFKNKIQVTQKVKLYCYNNNIAELPKCKFTGDDVYVSYNQITKVSKYLWDNLIKYDDQIKCSFFKWYNLLESGASIEELIKLKNEKKLFKIRNFFSNCLDKHDLNKELLKDGFLDEAAQNIIGDLDFNDWNKIKQFINRFEYSKKFRNMNINYYTIRGYTESVAKEKIYNQANIWAKIQNQIKENPKRYEEFCNSRLKGLYAQNKISKFEQKIYDELKLKNYSVSQQYEVKIKHKNLLKNKSKLICDIIINDSIIVEYFGSYWHNDILKYENMSYDNYIKEILRLRYINLISGKSIIVLWEYDLNLNLDKAIKIIENHINSGKQFTSSRDLDYQLYDSVFSLKEAENITQQIDIDNVF